MYVCVEAVGGGGGGVEDVWSYFVVYVNAPSDSWVKVSAQLSLSISKILKCNVERSNVNSEST